MTPEKETIINLEQEAERQAQKRAESGATVVTFESCTSEPAEILRVDVEKDVLGETITLPRDVVEGLVNALKGYEALLHDGLLVRNTEHDADMKKFLDHGIRIVGHITAAKSAVESYEAALKETEE